MLPKEYLLEEMLFGTADNLDFFSILDIMKLAKAGLQNTDTQNPPGKALPGGFYLG